MQKQSAYIREFHAITEALEKFRHYLLSHKFIIRTNQKSLKELLEQRLQTPEQQQWLPKFLGYDFVIQYKPGRENLPANALSRSFLMAWLEAVGVWMNQVSALLQEDNSLAAIYKQCMEGTVQGTEYAVKDGLLFWKGRMMIPSNKELKEQIMQEFHASKIGGHEGVTKSVSRICKQFYWPKMQQDIRDFVRQCTICQQAKVEQALPAGLLQPLPIPQRIWEDIAMDFITNLPPSRGYATIFVVVDRLSKFAHFIPLKATFNNKSVADAFISNFVKMHGFPKTIVSNRDRIFISSFWQQLLKAQGTI